MFCADELSAAVVAKIVSLGPIEVSEKRFKRNLRDNQLNFFYRKEEFIPLRGDSWNCAGNFCFSGRYTNGPSTHVCSM